MVDGGLSLAIESELREGSRLILVCAPASMGKTTAVFAALRRIRTRDVPAALNVERLNESPVEIEMLRSVGVEFKSLGELRKELPRSIIMMGDVRDKEVARLAIELAERGHAVVATVRVPAASYGFGRFVDMGIEARRVATVCAASFGCRIVEGFKQRIGIFEELKVSESIRALIAAESPPDAIFKEAVREGMRPIFERGLELVRDGLAGLEAVNSAVPR